MPLVTQPRLYTARHLAFAGVVDELGRELTHAHVSETVHNILGQPLVKLIKHLGPEHPDVAEAFHGRVSGRWHIDRYKVPIEYYIARLMGIKEADVPNTIVPAAVMSQAHTLLAKNNRAETSDFEDTFENLFTTTGVNTLFTIALSGVGTANTSGSAALATAEFNSTQSRIGVADGTTAATASDSDIQSTGSNKEWLVVSSAPVVSTNTMTFTTTFGTGDANYAWNNFGIDNCGGSNATSTTRSGGTMLDHVVSAQGTKASGQSWVPSFSLSIS